MTTQQMQGAQGLASGIVAQVTGADLLSRLDTHAATLARIEQEVKGTPAQIEAVHTLATDNATRVARLEQWRAFMTGIATVIVLLLSSGVAVALITAARR